MSYSRTPEHRARQSQAIRKWQPWEKSTGPKSAAGKVKAARNAIKYGGRSAQTIAHLRDIRLLLAECRQRLLQHVTTIIK